MTDKKSEMRQIVAALDPDVRSIAAALEALDMDGVAGFVRRQQAEIETLRAGYDAARLEIESLRGKGWQPISTAPKNGTAVLVYPPTWAGRGCSMAQYESDRYAAKPRPYWSRDDAFGKIGYSRNKPPTHWMPLPAGPAEGESNG